MKALILAAGRGTRLSPITDEKPKALVCVNRKPILFKQIENLHANGIKDITIISGYCASMLEMAVHEHWPEIKFVESSNYYETNNMYSAYLGLKAMYPNGDYGSFLMMNADVFFDSSVLSSLLAWSSPNAVVVDIGHYLEESMKVMEKDGRLVAISKQISEQDAFGSSIDVYKFSPEGGKVFFSYCVDYIENKKDLTKWSEVALNNAFTDVAFQACPLGGRWSEIDNIEDLIAAEKEFIEVR